MVDKMSQNRNVKSAYSATRISINYQTYVGARYIGCGLTLHYLPDSELQVSCTAEFPVNDNYRINVCKAIEKTCQEKLFVGQFIVEEIDFHPIYSSQNAFENAAQQAVLAILGLLSFKPLTME